MPQILEDWFFLRMVPVIASLPMAIEMVTAAPASFAPLCPAPSNQAQAKLAPRCLSQIIDLSATLDQFASVSPPRLGFCRASAVRRPQAFTLVEILVVIAIIAILVALSFPTYRSFIDKANTATCVANLRECSGLVSTFAAERGFYPPTMNLVTTSQGQQNLGGIFSIEFGFEKCLVCPSATYHGVNPGWETTPQRWRQTGYAANEVIMPARSDNATTTPPKVTSLTGPMHISRPSKVIMLADGLQIGTGTKASPAFVYPVFNQGWNTTANNSPQTAETPLVEGKDVPAGQIPFRHNNRANILFCDGHVESIKAISELKRKNISIAY